MKKNKKLYFWLIFFFLISSTDTILNRINAQENAELNTSEKLNEEIKKEEQEEEIKKEEQVELQKNIENNKKKKVKLEKEVVQVNKEIKELKSEINTAEQQTVNTLKLIQKIDNSGIILSIFNQIIDINDSQSLSSIIITQKQLKQIITSLQKQILDFLELNNQLKEKEKNLQKDIENLDALEKLMKEKLDDLEDKEKKQIIAQGYNYSRDFFDKECKSNEVYGKDCGDKLTEESEFLLPISSGYETNGFQEYDAIEVGDGHTGIDLVGDETIYPTASGQVVNVFVDSYGGIQVMMIHYINNKNYITNYAHLSSVDVIPGDIIDVDEPLGKMGSTGVTTGKHLHFEIIEGPYYIHSELENPIIYLDLEPYKEFKGRK